VIALIVAELRVLSPVKAVMILRLKSGHFLLGGVVEGFWDSFKGKNLID
jgi:hypothetical protein